MSQSKEIVIRDEKLRGFYKQIGVCIDLGHIAADKQAWTEALTSYQKGLETVNKAIAYCKKSTKRAYLGGLNEFIGSLNFDCGRCLLQMGEVEQSLECYQKAYNGGVKEALNKLFAISHNRGDYGRAYPYLLLEGKYKTVPITLLYDYAVLLSQGGKGIEINLNKALFFFLYIVDRQQKGDTLLDAKNEKGFFAEKIAQIYCELKNTPKELEWRLKAVREDLPMALHNYGEMLNDGQGVKRNEEEALKYHLRAAEKGHYDAMVACAIHYYKSDRIPVDLDKAEYWLNQALPLDSGASAAVLYCGLILANYDAYPEKKQKLYQLIPLVEKFAPDEAKNIRACIMLYQADAGQDQVKQAADMLAELADQGLPSAQYNLAVIYHTRPGFRRELAVPLYLDAIARDYLVARHNLYLLIYELALESNGDEKSLVKFFRSFEQRYRRALPMDLRKEDTYLSFYVKLIHALEESTKGNVTEVLKVYFPKVNTKLNTEIVSVNSAITRVAQVETVSIADRIAGILEMGLFCGSNRSKTCAFRRIGEILAINQDGFGALVDNLSGFNQLTAEIVANPLDNEAYMELAVGLAKLKIHPGSSLVSHCYQKLHEYHSDRLNLENLFLTPYQSCMLLSSLSDLPLSLDSFSSTLIAALAISSVQITKMNAWQILKSLQALCVLHAYHKIKNDNISTTEIFENALQKILEINPAEFSMIDLYQLFLCLNYIDKTIVAKTQVLRKKFQPQLLEMMQWLKNQRPTPSQSQARLARYLGNYRTDVCLEKYVNGLYVDIFLQDAKVVVEFDGPYHFMKSLPHEDLPLLRSTRDSFHERIIGLPIVRVNHIEFEALNHTNREQIRKFLHKKLAVVGISLTGSSTELEQQSQYFSSSSHKG